MAARRLVLNGLTAEVQAAHAAAPADSPDSLEFYHELELYRLLAGTHPPARPAARRSRTPDPPRARRQHEPLARRSRTPGPAAPAAPGCTTLVPPGCTALAPPGCTTLVPTEFAVPALSGTTAPPPRARPARLCFDFEVLVSSGIGLFSTASEH